MIKLNFIFLSDFQAGNMWFHEELIKEFEYPHHLVPPSKGEGQGGGNGFK